MLDGTLIFWGGVQGGTNYDSTDDFGSKSQE